MSPGGVGRDFKPVYHKRGHASADQFLALFMMYLPPLFPVLLRTTGAGFCYNIGRIAAAAGTVIFGMFLKVGDYQIALFALAYCSCRQRSSPGGCPTYPTTTTNIVGNSDENSKDAVLIAISGWWLIRASRWVGVPDDWRKTRFRSFQPLE